MKKHIIEIASWSLLLLLAFGCKKNKAPETPAVPFSTETYKGWVDSTYWFYTNAEDPEDDDVSCRFDWGDGTISEWSKYVGSKREVKMRHIYTASGTYEVKAQAKDINKNESGWSAPYVMKITSKSPPPDSVKIIDAPDTACVFKPQTFLIQGWDSDLDSLRYLCTFIGIQHDIAGDKVFLDTTVWSVFGTGGVYPSGGIGKIEFPFQDTGTYIAIPLAQDIHGSSSEWGDSCTGKIIPPRKPYTPTLGKEENYPVYLTQTLYSFWAKLSADSLVDHDIAITFEYAWGDDDTSAHISPDPSTPDPPAAVQSHAYKTGGTVEITVRVEDKWEQFSNPSIPTSMTITDNFINQWKIDLMDTTAHAFGIVSAGDSVYVVDNYNHEIKVFSKDGVLVKDFGADVLSSPMYVAVDDEFVYVTDAYQTWQPGHKVYKFKKDGSLDTSWGGYGSAQGEFKYPTGIAVDTAYVYVMDHDNKRIQKFKKDGTYITEWECPKSRGITIDQDYLYVASYLDNYIRKFNTEGIEGASIGGKGSDDGKLLGPQDIAICGTGLYVIEMGNSRVQKLTKDGIFINRWGCEGSEKGQFRNPWGITIDNEGNVYVVDSGNRRIQKFDGSL